jgi:predicted DNA-binding transcriptional regulator YafY
VNDTLIRQWQILQLVPREPRRATAQTIADQLSDRGFDVVERTVQRDLKTLALIFGDIGTLEHSKPFQWFWRKSTVLNLPAMDINTALALRLAEDQLKATLPSAVRQTLGNQFEQAHKVLDQAQQRATAWPDKVRVLPAGFQLQAPALEADVLQAVQTALFEERQLALDYVKANGDNKQYVVHPLALVWRGAVGYLVGHYDAEQAPRQFVLHRIQTAVVVAQARQLPQQPFVLDDWLADGNMQMRLGDKPLALRLWVQASIVYKLEETPLSADQVMEPAADGAVVLTATVPNTQQLRSFLRSYGDYMEVLEPDSLREEIAATVRQLAARYGTAG